MEKRSIRERWADFWGLDKAAALDMTSITASGNREIYIDNHKGIAEYTDELIKIKTKNGIVEIVGSSLRIDMIRAYDVFISGYIRGIGFNFVGDEKNVK